MGAIQERAIRLAAKSKIYRKADGSWSVPSQAGDGRYVIKMGEKPTCTCAYHDTYGTTCKHIFAVNYFLSYELNEDGSETVTETVTVTSKRKTYPQQWSAYNAAQVSEKTEFQRLLYSLCSGIEEPLQVKGRPRLPLSDAVFNVVFKVYSTVSGRRFMSDLTDAQAKGYIRKVPHFNSIFNYLEHPEMASILDGLITQSSLPLAALEEDVATDSTGFRTTGFTNWFSEKYGEVRDGHDWVKAHVCCGVATNVITAVRIGGRNANDSPFFPELLGQTAENFQIRHVVADKGYCSKSNYKAAEELGIVPYIAFLKNAQPDRTPGTKREKNNAWTRMYHLYSLNREEFLSHYHVRSNVESTFMSIKARLGEKVRSKTPVSQYNEVLCKFLCHNICCIIRSMHEFGIEAEFGRAA